LPDLLRGICAVVSRRAESANLMLSKPLRRFLADANALLAQFPQHSYRHEIVYAIIALDGARTKQLASRSRPPSSPSVPATMRASALGEHCATESRNLPALLRSQRRVMPTNAIRRCPASRDTPQSFSFLCDSHAHGGDIFLGVPHRKHDGILLSSGLHEIASISETIAASRNAHRSSAAAR